MVSFTKVDIEATELCVFIDLICHIESNTEIHLYQLKEIFANMGICFEEIRVMGHGFL